MSVLRKVLLIYILKSAVCDIGDILFSLALKVYCLTSHEQSSLWNTNRDPAEQYNQDMWVRSVRIRARHSHPHCWLCLCNLSCVFWSCDALVQRFEAPDSRNRWDSPLFTILKDDTLPFEAISDALFKRKAPPPNQSTHSVRTFTEASCNQWEHLQCLLHACCAMWSFLTDCEGEFFFFLCSNRSHLQTSCMSWTKSLKMS